MKSFALLVLFSAQATSTFAQSVPNRQKFICNTGYTEQQCHRQIHALRPVLDKFHADALGEWTWILVRSEDWRPLMYRFRANPDSPAITFLKERTTLFEEALIAPTPDRQAELLKNWGRAVDQLLEEAVSHELGHSFCNDSDEAKAEYRARKLQRGERVSCSGSKEGPSRAKIGAGFQP